jgi:hypothetical protein
MQVHLEKAGKESSVESMQLYMTSPACDRFYPQLKNTCPMVAQEK